jgi:GTP-binding protein LepA
MDTSKIRNFCIIAHIDHGKSTLADRILELTGTVARRDMREQLLDSNSLERERGITIKAKAVAMNYKGYQLNLIDTPGHVDFNYEVSRSLAACEGAVLLVDCTQGVQAQTVANALLAQEGALTIVPALNKVDMQTAQIEESLDEMENSLAIPRDEVLHTSGKMGTGVPELLDRVIEKVPAPTGDINAPFKALIFDSEFNEFRGVVVYIRIIDGRIRRGDKIKFLGTGVESEVEYVGVFTPQMKEVDELTAGRVGYLMANLKSVRDVRVGDTVVAQRGADKVKPLAGYKEPLPVVFCGFYPTGETDYDKLKKALERLSLNDGSFKFAGETSEALGFGFRCGFLGLLHMEIIQERLEREENVELIQTAPNVTYEVLAQTPNGRQVLRIDNPAKLPDDDLIHEWREPMIRAAIIIPTDCIGVIMTLCRERRGTLEKT